MPKKKNYAAKYKARQQRNDYNLAKKTARYANARSKQQIKSNEKIQLGAEGQKTMRTQARAAAVQTGLRAGTVGASEATRGSISETTRNIANMLIEPTVDKNKLVDTESEVTNNTATEDGGLPWISFNG